MKTHNIITAALLSGTALFLNACATGKGCCKESDKGCCKESGGCCSKGHKSHGASDASATKHDHSAAAASSAHDASAHGAATVAAVKPYPLKTCLVSGKPLDSMDGEVRIVHEGQEVKFCCKACQTKFLKDPAKFLSKLK